MGQFYRFQRSIAGGDIPQAQPLNNTRHVHIIVQELDPQGTGLGCLIRNNSFDIWDKWAKPRLQEKKLKGNTIRVYLRSLESFLKWIKDYKNPSDEDDSVDGKLTEHLYSRLLKLLPQMANYSKIIHRRTATDFSNRIVNEAYERLTNEDLQLYENSNVVRNAVKLLGKAAEGHELSLNEVTLVRDYFMTQLIIDNGSRPGPIQYARVNRFKMATPNSSETNYIMLINDHKTTQQHGPVELSIRAPLFRHLQIYVDFIRPRVAQLDADTIFVTAEGNAFRRGTVGKRVTEMFVKAGVRNEIRVSSTRIRKFHSTEVTNASP